MRFMTLLFSREIHDNFQTTNLPSNAAKPIQTGHHKEAVVVLKQNSKSLLNSKDHERHGLNSKQCNMEME